ncbi:MAG: hypothetical protein Q4B08_08170 [Propionibacteriaceae bacterium]|nr:hypothetical protein [Propionibacteriaceae bacterium]
MSSGRNDYIIDAAKARCTGPIDISLAGYITDGGTYILASRPEWTDSGRPRDLVAVLTAPLQGTRVIPLWPAVNPDLVADLRAALDGQEEAA